MINFGNAFHEPIIFMSHEYFESVILLTSKCTVHHQLLGSN